jgi:nitrate/nitrite transporter NarK
MLYAIYSYPNIILPFIGGVAIDKIGAGPSGMICSIILTAG